jgi:radical SAM superfamily enzyme YgiQ (UPF0313 family)
MAGLRTILFLQIPRLDHDANGRRENVPLAAVYMRNALEKSGEAAFHRVVSIPRADDLDDRHLLSSIARLKPDVIAATLYLWNVERTLDLLGKARKILPKLKVVAGGPEVAADHPFLFRKKVVDVAVSGEGENVFPDILKAFRIGQRFAAGAKPPPCNLQTCLPSPSYSYNKPDTHGMAYLETTRGCPLRCSYCCYGHRRHAVSFLHAEEVLARVRILCDRGAREIRFIDPTFNANPEFRRIIAGLAGLNRNRRLEFFAELQADRITTEDARLLASANFREIEVGVQSRNPETLRRIHRPTDLGRLDLGIRALARAGILVTVDLMYGLPGQDLREIRQMLNWAARLRGVRVQCLQTLLLPGTELRRDRKRYRLNALDRPPYQVQSTTSLSAKELRRAEMMVQRKLGIVADCPTKRFVGRELPDLFQGLPAVAGSENRRSMFFEGRNLFARRRDILSRIRQAVAAEPNILWQFVLEPHAEEPLDLFDALIAELEKFPPLVSDRFLDMHSPGKRASRRVMIRLRPGRKYDASWQEAAEQHLRKSFF